ncbi:MAG: hypothetical protein IPK82_10000 [Polyangiaceae bacterium]|nr:hypothetical protein [Polyangiaceae bacterium]
MKALPGRRAIWLTRGGKIMQAFEPAMFGLSLAGGIYLATHQAGHIVVLDRGSAASNDMLAPGLLLLLGVTLVVASLLFFHRKGRKLWQRLVAAGVATSFFAVGYTLEMRREHTESFFGVATVSRENPFFDDVPGRAALIRLSRWGLRGDDFPESKPPNEHRVALIGGGPVFGTGVSESETLAVKLTDRLQKRGFSKPVRVLNLGVPRAHLASHLAMIEIAERKLGANVIVVCLSFPADLSLWDLSVERREHATVSGFSFVSFMFGYKTAALLFRERNIARDVSAENVVFLQTELARFAAARTERSVPIYVVALGSTDPRVQQAVEAVRGATYLAPVRLGSEHLIDDTSHPNGGGNDLLSERIETALPSALFAE